MSNVHKLCSDLYQQAQQAYQLGELVQADNLLQQLLQQDPLNTPALWLQIAANYQLRAIDRTIHLLSEFLSIQPNHADALYKLTQISIQHKIPETALPFLQAYHEHGNLHIKVSYLYAQLLATSDKSQAQALLSRFLSLYPQHWQAWNLLGNIFKENDELASAASCYSKANELAPEEIGVLYNLALTQYEQTFYELSYQTFHKILSIDPNHLATLYRVAVCAQCLCDYPTAEKYYKQVLAAEPQRVNAWLGLGFVLEAQQLMGEAENAYRQASYLEPDSRVVSYSFYHLKLSCQQIPAGWRAFLLVEKYPVHFLLESQSISHYTSQTKVPGKLLLVEEAGLGDVIQTLRFIPQLQAQGHEVSFLVSTSRGNGLSSTWDRLMADNFPDVRLLYSVEDVDAPVYVPLMQTMDYLQVTLQDISSDAYLSVSEAQVLPHANSDKIAIGLVWASGKKVHTPHFYNSYLSRSTGLQQFSRIVRAFPQCNFYGLQVGVDNQELHEHSDLGIIDLTPYLQDMYDTAVYIMQLDLVITVDTAVAHLAGALGKPVWILLPRACDWRWWHSEGNTSPWYQSARLFRQSEFLQWEPVIESVIQELGSYLLQK